jgi:hypothetical protein
VELVPKSSIKAALAGESSRIFFYKDLGSVEYRAPAKLLEGFMEFVYPGAKREMTNLFKFGSILNNVNREVSDKAHEFIMGKIAAAKHPVGNSVITQISDTDELAKFKKLLDDGIISQAEFDAKKEK